MRETGRNGYQKQVKDRLEATFKNCMIFKMDPNEHQGIPDLLILYKDKWATLETKGSIIHEPRPNQLYYVTKMNEMSCSAFIFPENEDDVFEELKLHFSVPY